VLNELNGDSFLAMTDLQAFISSQLISLLVRLNVLWRNRHGFLKGSEVSNPKQQLMHQMTERDRRTFIVLLPKDA
jgi:hypothetical protein